MFPSPFDYVAASSVDEAIHLLQQHGEDAKLLAGGHSLIPLMKLRLAAPSVVIDIGRITDLAGVQVRNGGVEIGALTTYTAALDSADLGQSFPLIVETASEVGDMQVRNRGTLGGAVAHADPSADMPAAMLALNATFKARGPEGERTMSAPDFFQGPFTTDLQPEEVLTHITVAGLPPRSGTAYEKMRNPASGYAVVGVAAVISLDDRDAVSDVRIAVTGAGSQPVRATAAEDRLRGRIVDESVIAEAAQHVTDGLDVLGDIYASPDYRSHVARVHARRALNRALQRTRA